MGNVMVFCNKSPGNDRGSAILTSMLILVALSVLGIASLNTSSLEIKIAGNERIHKETFFEAEGGTEVGREVLEQNIACLGFASDNYHIGTSPDFVKISDRDFYLNENGSGLISDSNWDIYYPDKDESDNTENFDSSHTKMVVFGDTELSEGSAVLMAAGYAGKGKGAGAGGGEIVYEIHSEHEKPKQDSAAHIVVQYRHLIGQEGDCEF